MFLCPDITEFISGFVGVDLMPHTMPHQLGHLNYAPKTVGENIDKWHVDTLRYDYVMFVTDPAKQQAGHFSTLKEPRMRSRPAGLKARLCRQKK